MKKIKYLAFVMYVGAMLLISPVYVHSKDFDPVNFSKDNNSSPPFSSTEFVKPKSINQYLQASLYDINEEDAYTSEQLETDTTVNRMAWDKWHIHRTVPSEEIEDEGEEESEEDDGTEEAPQDYDFTFGREDIKQLIEGQSVLDPEINAKFSLYELDSKYYLSAHFQDKYYGVTAPSEEDGSINKWITIYKANEAAIKRKQGTYFINNDDAEFPGEIVAYFPDIFLSRDNQDWILHYTQENQENQEAVAEEGDDDTLDEQSEEDDNTEDNSGEQNAGDEEDGEEDSEPITEVKFDCNDIKKLIDGERMNKLEANLTLKEFDTENFEDTEVFLSAENPNNTQGYYLITTDEEDRNLNSWLGGFQGCEAKSIHGREMIPLDFSSPQALARTYHENRFLFLARPGDECFLFMGLTEECQAKNKEKDEFLLQNLEFPTAQAILDGGEEFSIAFFSTLGTLNSHFAPDVYNRIIDIDGSVTSNPKILDGIFNPYRDGKGLARWSQDQFDNWLGSAAGDGSSLYTEQIGHIVSYKVDSLFNSTGGLGGYSTEGLTDENGDEYKTIGVMRAGYEKGEYGSNFTGFPDSARIYESGENGYDFETIETNSGATFRYYSAEDAWIPVPNKNDFSSDFSSFAHEFHTGYSSVREAFGTQAFFLAPSNIGDSVGSIQQNYFVLPTVRKLKSNYSAGNWAAFFGALGNLNSSQSMSSLIYNEEFMAFVNTNRQNILETLVNPFRTGSGLQALTESEFRAIAYQEVGCEGLNPEHAVIGQVSQEDYQECLSYQSRSTTDISESDLSNLLYD